MNLISFGVSLRRLRESAELTLETLSAKTAVAKNGILAIEKGRGNPTIGTLQTLAKFFNKGLIVSFGSKDEERLLDLFRLADPKNAARIISYAEGLIDGHQSERPTRLKRPY